MLQVAAFISVGLVSLISFSALLGLAIHKALLRRVTFVLVSLAVGTLLGDAFLHLIPEVLEVLSPEIAMRAVLGGLIIFFLIEKGIHWHHDHHLDHEGHVHSVGYMNVLADALHNGLDGFIIAVAYLVSLPLGIATTVAVIAHEIPQEISDFGILIHAGLTVKKALILNFLSALVAFLGAAIGLLVGAVEQSSLGILVAVTAGGFIYIAVADLFPAIIREKGRIRTLLQLAGIALGLVIMFALLALE